MSRKYSREVFIAEYLFLWDLGVRDDDAIALRLGLSRDTMQTARRRAIKDGVKIPLIPRRSTKYV